MTTRQPRFALDDTFYRMTDNTVLKDTIRKICIFKVGDRIEVTYSGASIPTTIYEEDIFETKQALLESL